MTRFTFSRIAKKTLDLVLGFVAVVVIFFWEPLYNTWFARGAYTSVSYSHGRVVFIRNTDIYSIAIDGTDLKRLTYTSLRETEVTYAPSGNKICFARQIKGQKYDYNDLFVMDPDGQKQKKIFNGSDGILVHDFYFSSDENKIIFYRWDSRQAWGTFQEMNTDGTGMKDVSTKDKNNGAKHADRSKITSTMPGPILTEDGRQKIYLEGFGHSRAIKIMDVDGSNSKLIVKI